MFEKKKVSQLVSEFLEKVGSREGKIRENLSKLQAQVKEIKNKIAEQTAAMIECELHDDTAGAQKLRASVRLLSTELTETEASAQAYSTQSGAGADYSKQLSEIRSAAAREVQDNQKQVQLIYKQKEAIDQEIKALEAKKRQLDNEQSQLMRSGPEASLPRLLPYIDARTKKLASFELNNFFQLWINAENIEHLLADKPVFNGITVNQNDIQKSIPKPVVHMKRYQTLNKQEAYKAFKAQNPNAQIVEVEGLDKSQHPLEIHYTMND